MADLSPPTSMFAFVTNWLTPTSLFLFLNMMIAAIALASRFGSHNKPVQEGQPLAPPPSLLQRVKSIDYYFYKFPPAQEPEYATSTRQHDPPHLERAPSLLERVKSINFSSLYYRSEREETTQHTATETGSDADPGTGHLERAPSLLERVKSINFSTLYYRSEQEETTEHPITESRSDVHPGTGLDSGNVMETHDHLVNRSKSEHMKAATKRPQKMKKSASEKAVALELAEEMEREKVERRRPATTRTSEKTVWIGDEGVDAKADDFINRFKQQLKLQRLDSLLRYKEILKGKQKI